MSNTKDSPMELKKRIIELLKEKGPCSGESIGSAMKAEYWALVHAINHLTDAGLIGFDEDKNEWGSEKIYFTTLRDLNSSTHHMRLDLDHHLLRLHYLANSAKSREEKALIETANQAREAYESALNDIMLATKP